MTDIPFKRNYKKYSQFNRKVAVNLAQKLNSFKRASEILEISINNIKRWTRQGCFVHKRGGRKLSDPRME